MPPPSSRTPATTRRRMTPRRREGRRGGQSIVSATAINCIGRGYQSYRTPICQLRLPLVPNTRPKLSGSANDVCGMAA